MGAIGSSSLALGPLSMHGLLHRFIRLSGSFVLPSITEIVLSAEFSYIYSSSIWINGYSIRATSNDYTTIIEHLVCFTVNNRDSIKNSWLHILD